MKRSIVLLSMLFLVLFAVVIPASAQDATTSDAPPQVCTQDELKQIADVFQPVSQSISEDGSLMGSAKTADDWTVSLLAWGDLYQSYFNDVFSSVPPCIDGLLIRDVVGLLLSQEVSLTSTALLNVQQAVTSQTDPDLNTAYGAFVASQGPLIKNLADSFTGLLDRVTKGTASTSWLPACDDAALTFTTQLDAFQTTYSDQVSGLQDYLSDGATVHKATYLAIIQLINDLNAQLKASAGTCGDLYARSVSAIYVFNDTFSAMNIGLSLTYMSPDSANIDAFTSLHEYMDGTLAVYTTPATEEAATETP